MSLEQSVGIVAPQRVRFDEPLPLKCGALLPGFDLVYETYGTLALSALLMMWASSMRTAGCSGS